MVLDWETLKFAGGLGNQLQMFAYIIRILTTAEFTYLLVVHLHRPKNLNSASKKLKYYVICMQSRQRRMAGTSKQSRGRVDAEVTSGAWWITGATA